MSDSEFCKIWTSYTGEKIDNIEQLKKISFDGVGLKEFVEFVKKEDSPIPDGFQLVKQI